MPAQKTFQLLGRSDYRFPQCVSVCHVRNFLFEDQRKSFFLSLFQGKYIFEERSKSVQDDIGDVFCPGKLCFNREKCESLDGIVTTPRSIYGCGKCGTWFFVHKLPFTLHEHVTRTKTEQAFSLLMKLNLLPNEQLFNIVLFHLTKNRKKEMCVDNKVQETNADVYVQHVAMKNVFTLQPTKLSVSTIVECARPALT